MKKLKAAKRPVVPIGTAPPKRPFRGAPSRDESGVHLSWRVAKADFAGPWSWLSLAGNKFHDVHNKLCAFEKMTWGEIAGNGNKAIPIENICTEAQKRLTALDLDDAEELWELRLSGKERVWGMRLDTVYYLLWWDPTHTVCPSGKKHT